LQGFDVQKLDWQRPDLSIDTIRFAAPNVRTLHLYSSGNWAPIDHWTGPLGISTLAKLEALHLTIISDNVSPARANKYKQDAEQRLSKYHPGPNRKWKKPIVDIRPWQAARSIQGQDATTEDFMTPIEATKLNYFLPHYKELLNDSEFRDQLESCRIKAAIIDSGVDRVSISKGNILKIY